MSQNDPQVGDTVRLTQSLNLPNGRFLRGQEFTVTDFGERGYDLKGINGIILRGVPDGVFSVMHKKDLPPGFMDKIWTYFPLLRRS